MSVEIIDLLMRQAHQARTLQAVACVCHTWSGRARAYRFDATAPSRSVEVDPTDPRQARWLARVAPRMHTINDVRLMVDRPTARPPVRMMIGWLVRQMAHVPLEAEACVRSNLEGVGVCAARSAEDVEELAFVHALACSAEARACRGQPGRHDPTLLADASARRVRWVMAYHPKVLSGFAAWGSGLWQSMGALTLEPGDTDGLRVKMYMGARLDAFGAEGAASMAIEAVLLSNMLALDPGGAARAVEAALVRGVPVRLRGPSKELLSAVALLLAKESRGPLFRLAIEPAEGPADGETSALPARATAVIATQRGAVWTRAQCGALARAFGHVLAV